MKGSELEGIGGFEFGDNELDSELECFKLEKFESSFEMTIVSDYSNEIIDENINIQEIIEISDSESIEIDILLLKRKNEYR
ncbi:9937_t:CDS:2 [Racocetra fulgida]|uniref:9937_t:CDS:1 n=1 Tax=Racocetra fulgida TaxID=60492 RepID=A0A9N8VLS7_9GLOM|nr:9937_t:CDS:2 [Racocetra fulgida]